MTDSPDVVIRAGSDVVTLINVFTVDPADRNQPVETWQHATDEVMRHQPGFISASIHRSYDGTKVINYAQLAVGVLIRRCERARGTDVVDRVWLADARLGQWMWSVCCCRRGRA